MNMQILEKALCLARVNENTTDEMRKQIDEALDEIAEVTNLTKDIADIWHGDACLIHISDAMDLLNRNMYDAYGRMKRTLGNVTLELFIAACRSNVECSYGFEYWPKAALEAGYEFIADLWTDNEAEGNNLPDGSFNKNN